MSSIEQRFLLSLAARRVAFPVTEHRFDEGRAWRFDFAWPAAMLAVEIEGGAFSCYQGERSRHTEGAGYSADCDKYNRGAELGWTVLRYTDRQVDSGEGAAQVERILVARLGDAAHTDAAGSQDLAGFALRGDAPARGARRKQARGRTERFGEATATEVAS